MTSEVVIFDNDEDDEVEYEGREVLSDLILLSDVPYNPPLPKEKAEIDFPVELIDEENSLGLSLHHELDDMTIPDVHEMFRLASILRNLWQFNL